MKNLNAINISFIFAGCFLGAGFLSGNELKQFFGNFGAAGIFGCAVAVAAICLFGVMIIYIARKTGTEKVEDIVLPWRSKWIGSVLGVFQCLLVFAIIVIMTSGAATLLYETIALPRYIAAALFSLLLAVVTLTGIGGMSAFFSLLIPAIAVFSVAISIYVCAANGIPDIAAVEVNDTNPLLSHWALASLSYLSYSIFSSVGIISPLAGRVKNSKTYISGILLGGIILFVIAVAILLSVYALGSGQIGELPMLSVARAVGGVVGAIYACLLLGGMFGAALTSMMSVSNYVTVKLKLARPWAVVIVLAALNFIGSLCGFGDLIGTVYPLYGYFGVIVLALISVNFISTLKSKK